MDQTTLENELATAFTELETEFEIERNNMKFQIDYQMECSMNRLKDKFHSLVSDICTKIDQSCKVSGSANDVYSTEPPGIVTTSLQGATNLEEMTPNGYESDDSVIFENEVELPKEVDMTNLTKNLNPLPQPPPPPKLKSTLPTSVPILVAIGGSGNNNGTIVTGGGTLNLNPQSQGQNYRLITLVPQSGATAVGQIAKMPAQILQAHPQSTSQITTATLLSTNKILKHPIQNHGGSTNLPTLILESKSSAQSINSDHIKQESNNNLNSSSSSSRDSKSPIRRSGRIERKRRIDVSDYYSDFVDPDLVIQDQESSPLKAPKRVAVVPKLNGETIQTDSLLQVQEGNNNNSKSIHLSLSNGGVKQSNRSSLPSNGVQKQQSIISSNRSSVGESAKRHVPIFAPRWKDNSLQSYSRTVYLNCPFNDCKVRLNKREDYDRHVASHGILPYRCTITGCGESFAKHPELGAHFRSAHNTLTEWSCNQCARTYKGYPRLITHLRYEHEFGLFTCVSPGCSFTAPNRKAICDHYVQLHREVNRLYVCDYPNCNRQCVSNTQLIYHQYHHLNLKPYQCQWKGCRQMCTRADAIYRHIEMIHLKLDACGSMEERRKLDQYFKVEEDQILKEPIRFSELEGFSNNFVPLSENGNPGQEEDYYDESIEQQ